MVNSPARTWLGEAKLRSAFHHQVAFSPSGRRVAVAGGDGRVRLVEAGSCATSSLPGDGDALQSVTFDHSGETVMSAGNDGLISVWSPREQEELLPVTGQ